MTKSLFMLHRKSGFLILTKVCFIAFSIISHSSCQSNKDGSPKQQTIIDTPATKQPLTLIDLRSKFKYHDLKTFKPDFSWDGLDRQFMRVDSTAFRLIFQEGDRKFMDDRYEQDYYYSWQNRDKNFIEFTILTPDESSNCLTLKYFIFDKNGKFISKFDIANTCGDAGWTFSADGKQVSSTKFIYNTDEADSDIEDIWEKGDSASYEITITNQGKIVEREIYKRPFTRKTRQ